MIAPPLQDIREIIFKREAFTTEVDIYIGDSSYILPWEDAKSWFLKLSKNVNFTESLFSYLWNMRFVRYFSDTMRFVPFTRREFEKWLDTSKR